MVGYNPWGRKKLDTTERLHFTSRDGMVGWGGECIATLAVPESKWLVNS